MHKERLIAATREMFLRPEHGQDLWRSFALPARPATLAGLDGGVDNLNLVLRDTQGRAFAVARHYLVTPADKVAAELDFVGFLAAQGFPTPQPIPTRGGASFLHQDGQPPIAVFRFVPGHHVRSWSAVRLRLGGQVLAEMHTLCARHGYRMGRSRDPVAILAQGLAGLARLDLADTGVFGAEVERFLAEDVARHGQTLAAQPFGPVHHDLNPGNVLWTRRGRLKAVIDFDEAHDAPLLMDLVMACQYLAVDDQQRLRPQAWRHLLDGYERCRPLGAEERGLLQYCWDLGHLAGAMEFIQANADWLGSALECRSFSRLYLGNRQALAALAAG